MTLSDTLAAVRAAPAAHEFRGAPVAGARDVMLGVDSSGSACLFIRSEGASRIPPMQTEKVKLRFDCEFTITLTTGATEAGRFHYLTLSSVAREDEATFLLVIEAFLQRFNTQGPTAESLASFFRSLIRLFSTQPAGDLPIARQGLWGELFFMRTCRGAAFWAPYWHSDPNRVFDFSAAAKRVEVKTTTSQQREHRFSHRQLFTFGRDEVAVASIQLIADDAGLTLRDLIIECRTALRDSELLVKLEQSVRRAGMDSPLERGPSFNADSARETLGWYWAEELPHFKSEEPEGVSETHYKVDLTRAPQIPSGRLTEWLNAWTIP